MQSLIFKHPYAKLVLFVLVVLLLVSSVARSGGVPGLTIDGSATNATDLHWNIRSTVQSSQLAAARQMWAPRISSAAAFALLQARATGPLTVHWDTQVGIPDWLTATRPLDSLPYTLSPAEHGNPLAIAQGFLDENRALFGLRSAADELTTLRSEPDVQRNFAHVRLGQVYHGIPVFGKQLVVHVDPQERITAVNGQFTPNIAIETNPTFNAQQAENLAVQRLNDQLEPGETLRSAPNVLKNKTQLMVYVDAAGKATLTWQVKIITWAPLGQWIFFVNARRPAIVHVIDNSDHAMRRKTYNANNTTDIPGDLVIDEGERSSRDPIAQAAHDGAGKVYDYYFKTFKRDAYDNQGSPMVSTVHFGVDAQDQENAAWVGDYAQMIYGDGGGSSSRWRMAST